MNCDAPLGSDSAKMYAQVLCCPACFETARRLEQRTLEELSRLQVLLKETIRIAMIRKSLHFPNGVEDVPKSELLQSILTLQEKRETGP
jgi:hypothetical protein